jgi:hypothetical protein
VILWILWIILFLITGPVYPAPHTLYVAIPEIEPQAEFGYLQTPVLNFIRERLSSKGYNVYIAEGRGESSGDLLKSKFYFERTGRVQIELSLIELKNSQEVSKVRESATFEDFWVKLEGVLTSLKGKVPPNQTTPFQEKPQETPKEVIPPVKESTQDTSKRIQKSDAEKESLLSRLNPFKAISKVLPQREDPLRIKVSIPPPPPPPYSPDKQASQNTFQERASLPQRIIPQAFSPQAPSPSQIQQGQSVTQPQAQPTSPWQWF